MKSIVRRDSGEDWTEYLTRLALAEGIEKPIAEDLRRLDRKWPDKKVSNQDWQSPGNAETRITKMKDGTTHLAYKAEHAADLEVDLESEEIVAACVFSEDRGDASSGPETVAGAQANLSAVQAEAAVSGVVMDLGYHDNGLLMECAEAGVRTYIAERKQATRRWTDKPPEQEAAFRVNRRRARGERGRRLSRRRSEIVERTSAHACETRGGWRRRLRGLLNVAELYLLRSAAYNLGLLLRKVWGIGKPRSWEAGWAAAMAGAAAFLAPSSRPEDAWYVPLTLTEVIVVFAIVGRAVEPGFSLLSTEPRKAGPF